MRHVSLLALLVPALALAASACFDSADDCNKTLSCGPAMPTTSTGSTSSGPSTGTQGGGGSSASGGGGGGSTTTSMVNCDPTLGAVDGTCGIFVSSSMGHDGDPGTKNNPVATLAHAISIASGSPIYACGEEFDEAITVPAGSTLYGALDCAHGWTYAALTPTHVVAPADAVALTLSAGAETTTVSDFAIDAADATAMGGSSIAVLANAATADLTRCALVAGKAAAGKPGDAQNPVQTPALADGGPGKPGCVSMSAVAGGDPGVNTCGSAQPFGGLGGGASLAGGAVGGDGLPQPMGTAPKDGKGGAGDVGLGCSAGDGGAPGTAGNPGAGAVGIGSLTAAGFIAATATDGGSPGTAGQGGGGGGGAAVCAANAGPSGGGGGAGGCGGAAGKAGGSGGSSIGLASFNAHVTLKDSSVSTAAGGGGGVGGDGQVGGNGGNQGNQSGSGACPGGVGGKGGRGGSAGGGAGGHSIAIAFQGGVAPITMTTTMTHDVAGAGAVGGDGDASIKGDNGKACSTLDFGDASSCAP